MTAVPYAFARRHGVLVTGWDGDRARVVHAPGVRPAILAELRRRLRRRVVLEAVTAGEFEGRLHAHYEAGLAEDFEDAVDAGGGDDEALDLHAALRAGEALDLMDSEDDAPIVRLINALLTEAIRQGASDVHVERFEERLVVRFRVDGVLREVVEPRPRLAPVLISRLKVMARLDIAEKRLPQDGRMALRLAGRPVDVRVSTLPVGQGERVVLRLLDRRAGRLDLGELGLAPGTRARLEALIRRPHGIVLVTGPTGSGKTTTLYAALAAINEPGRNIMTVEDPIEYALDGVSQTPVNPRIEMTFARGLRAILRQDPDVVMVGEIRDLETARIAVQAAHTGHLVFSTLHTNTAVGAVTRLRDLGVEPFLLASTVAGVLAQRLVRVLCPACRRGRSGTAEEARRLGLEHLPRVHEPVGCPACEGIGYRGRTGLHELVEVDEELRGRLHDGAAEPALVAHARSRGPGLLADGARLVRDGRTTVTEVLRVVGGEA